jgi:hypothetical protein
MSVSTPKEVSCGGQVILVGTASNQEKVRLKAMIGERRSSVCFNRIIYLLNMILEIWQFSNKDKACAIALVTASTCLNLARIVPE